ncbi:MAG TPA: hypothetical protein VL689_04565 [Paraburkholderia sp.]|jgi:hypothetical protein|nr:hypothetical protein [Paraburkholderia sp.]
MEKIMVIGGIWAMCALCAVLFIRGATLPGRERVPAGSARDSGRNDLDAMRRADRG